MIEITCSELAEAASNSGQRYCSRYCEEG